MRMSRPVGIGTGLFAGTMVAAVLVGDGFARGAVTGLVVGVLGFAVSFYLESRRPSDED